MFSLPCRRVRSWSLPATSTRTCRAMRNRHRACHRTGRWRRCRRRDARHLQTDSATPDGTAWEEHQMRLRRQVGAMSLSAISTRPAATTLRSSMDADTGRLRAGGQLSKRSPTGGVKPWKDVAFWPILKGGNHEMLACATSPPLNAFTIWNIAAAASLMTKGRQVRPRAARRLHRRHQQEQRRCQAIMVRTYSGGCRQLIVRNDGSDGIIKEFPTA